MRSFWSDPYLWIHLAGIAAVPLFLELCLVGLAAGDPILPLGLEWLLVAIAGIAPILWMQWQRPFSIFSLVLLAIKPSELSDDQRRLLRLFKGLPGQVVAVAIAVLMAGLLWKIYGVAPIATGIAQIVPGGHVGGLALAAIAFLLANLFIQVPASVVRVLLVSDAAFAATEPYPVEKIAADFVLLGIGVEEIVPPLVFEPKVSAPKRQKTQPIPTSSAFVDELFADEQVGDAVETPPELENQAEPENQVDSEVPGEPEIQAESEIQVEADIPAEPEIQVESEIPAEPEVQAESEIPAEPEIPTELAEAEPDIAPEAISTELAGTELAEAELPAEPQALPEDSQPEEAQPEELQPEEIQPDIQPEEVQPEEIQPDIQSEEIQPDIQPEEILAVDLEPAPDESPSEESSQELSDELSEPLSEESLVAEALPEAEADLESIES